MTTAPTAAVSNLDTRIALPPVQCAPWCVDGDGHPDNVADDQWCGGEILRVDLSQQPRLAQWTFDTETGEWREGPDYLQVYAMLRPGATITDRLEIFHEEGPRSASPPTRRSSSSRPCSSCWVSCARCRDDPEG